MMQKPVKKFSGGLMKAVSKAMPQIKKAVEASSGVPPEATPEVVSKARGPLGKIVTAMATASPQGGQPPARRGPFGSIARAAAEAVKNAPASSAQPQGKGILGRAAKAAATAVAKRARPTGMKKGGAVIKKAVKKTTRKK